MVGFFRSHEGGILESRLARARMLISRQVSGGEDIVEVGDDFLCNSCFRSFVMSDFEFRDSDFFE